MEELPLAVQKEVGKQLAGNKVQVEIDKQSMKKAQKAKSLERSLEVPIPQEVFDRLTGELEDSHG